MGKEWKERSGKKVRIDREETYSVFEAAKFMGVECPIRGMVRSCNIYLSIAVYIRICTEIPIIVSIGTRLNQSLARATTYPYLRSS